MPPLAILSPSWGALWGLRKKYIIGGQETGLYCWLYHQLKASLNVYKITAEFLTVPPFGDLLIIFPWLCWNLENYRELAIFTKVGEHCILFCQFRRCQHNDKGGTSGSIFRHLPWLSSGVERHLRPSRGFPEQVDWTKQSISFETHYHSSLTQRRHSFFKSILLFTFMLSFENKREIRGISYQQQMTLEDNGVT